MVDLGTASTLSTRRASRVERTARFCASRPWVVIVVWLGVLAGATVTGHALGTTYTDDFGVPGTSSQTGADLVSEHLSVSGRFPSPLVFRAEGSLLAHQPVVDAVIQDVRAIHHVTTVSGPFEAPSTLSTDGRAAYATVRFDINPMDEDAQLLAAVDRAVAPARQAGLQVDYGGTLGQASRPLGADRASELLGLTVAIAVMLLAFGSVLAAAVTVAGAVSGTLLGLALLAVVGSMMSFATLAPTLGVMLGLGVGLDYALFTTTRFRQFVLDGVDPVDAATQTVARTARTVVIAATLVVAALLCLYASGVTFLGRLGVAAGLTVACAPLATLTLVPALLGLAGRRIDRLRVRQPVAEPSGASDAWGRYAARVGRHPWVFLVGGVLTLLLLAAPALTIHIGFLTGGDYPNRYTDRRAFDTLSQAYGPGVNAPLTLVVQRSTPPGADLTRTVLSAVQTTPGVATVSPMAPSPDGSVLVTTVFPRSGPTDADTERLVHDLTDSVMPTALSGSDAKAYVTGATAAQLDLKDLVAGRLPVVIGTVAAITFCVLLVSFRSVVLAAKAAILNLVSIGAAYGVIVVLFQWGWGAPLFGLTGPVPIQHYVPIVIFAIVFGLSIDYEVFLLSRVYEAWLSTRDTHTAVVVGLWSTGRVITTAAITMTAVFLAFLTSENVIVKMISVGLGTSILIDATIVRLVVVPAAMYLFRSANWWMPQWLHRVLPDPPAPHHVDRFPV